MTQFTYGDAWGNLTQVVQDPGGAGHLNRTTVMAYDVMGRVKQSTDPKGQESDFTYNALGQPLTVKSYNASHVLQETVSYSYGGNGRTDSVTDSRGTTSMTYEAGCDRVSSVSDPVAGTTGYAYDGQTMVRSLRQNGQGAWQAAATYLPGPRGMEYRRDDLTGQVRWYVYDGLGSVVGELDPSGNLTAGKKYDVYGAERAGGTGTSTSRQGYVGSLGHVTDAETGLVYMKARYYDANVGRFISEDPSKDGLNWYTYCSNNATNSVDPDGKFEIPWLVDLVVGGVLALLGKYWMEEKTGAFFLRGLVCAILGYALLFVAGILAIKAAAEWGAVIKERLERRMNSVAADRAESLTHSTVAAAAAYQVLVGSFIASMDEDPGM